MVMEFSLINVNLNIDRKLFVFMCAGLMLAVVLSDEANPVANILRSIPPISLLDRYVIPVIKNTVGYFRGYGTMSGTIGAKVPINADNFVPRGDESRDGSEDQSLGGGGGNYDHSVAKKVKGGGLVIDEEQALSFVKKVNHETVDEESMPKSQAELSKETAEDAHESAKYHDGEQTFRKGKRKFKVKR